MKYEYIRIQKNDKHSFGVMYVKNNYTALKRREL